MQLTVNEFVSSRQGETPALFSRTSGFRFFDSRGRLVHRVLPTGPRGFSAINVLSTGHQANHEESTRLALTFPLAGFAQVNIGGQSHRIVPGDAYVIAPSQRHSELRAGVRGTYESYTVLAPPSLTQRMRQESWRLRTNWHGAAAARHLFQLAFAMADMGRPMSAAAIGALEALIEDTFYGVIDDGADTYDAVSESRSAEVVHLATVYMREHFQLPISMTEVARSIGIGPRCMQLAFHERTGKSPKQVLAGIRLEALRQQLLTASPETTVASAAMAAGLFHLGRVGRAYFEVFGELPSETLLRKKA